MQDTSGEGGVQFWVGVTDGDWFDFLAARRPEEVNFWQPSAIPPRIMEAGWLFLFKRKKSNFVVGGGHFVRFTTLPCFLAWDAFGEKNGAGNLPDLVRITGSPSTRHEIGCNLLSSPFFFEREDWFPIPPNWSPNVQRGLTYDSDEQHGAALLRAVHDRLPRYQPAAAVEEIDAPRYGEVYLTRARLGQGIFRTLVTDAYHRRCAVTGEKTLPALEAAHIRDHAKEGPNRTSNGLLLRADIHRLYDDGYVTVDPDLRFVVSKRLKEDFENGREYYQFNGKVLQNLPDGEFDRPSRTFLEWHNANRFNG